MSIPIPIDHETGLSPIAWYRSQITRDRDTVCCMQYDAENESVTVWSEWAVINERDQLVLRYGLVPGSVLQIKEPQQVPMYLRHMQNILGMLHEHDQEKKGTKPCA